MKSDKGIRWGQCKNPLFARLLEDFIKRLQPLMSGYEIVWFKSLFPVAAPLCEACRSRAEVGVLHNVVTAQILCCIAQHDLAGFEYIAAIRYLERLIGVLLDDKYSNTALV